MGNKPSTPTTIGLRVEGGSYVAGDTVRGTVYLYVAKPLDATSIHLRVSGFEKAAVHFTTETPSSESTHNSRHNGRGRGRGNGRAGHAGRGTTAETTTATRTRHHHRRTKSEFFTLAYPIARFPSSQQQVEPGNYEFPFEVTLPPHLPGSMRTSKGKSHCAIRYRISAHVVRAKSNIFSGGSIESARFLRVVSSPPAASDVSRVASPPEPTPIWTCCCFSRGVMALSAEVAKSIVAPGDTVEVGFKLRNESTVHASRVEVTLHEVVTWCVGGRSERLERTAARRVLGVEEVAELEGSCSEREARRSVNTSQRRGIPDGDIVEPLTAAEGPSRRETTLTLPLDTRDTYDGKNIEVFHYVKVKIVTGFFTTSPQSIIKVRVRGLPGMKGGLDASDMPPPFAPVQPSAPPEYDDDEEELPEAELVLPDDWSAQIAEVVAIPTEEAIVVGMAEGTGQGGDALQTGTYV